MLGCGGADQQIHGRQRTVGSLAQQAILSGLYPPPRSLRERHIRVQRLEHSRHLLVLSNGAGRAAELNALGMTGTDRARAASMTCVAAVRALAMSFRYFEEACFHFMSA